MLLILVFEWSIPNHLPGKLSCPPASTQVLPRLFNDSNSVFVEGHQPVGQGLWTLKAIMAINNNDYQYRETAVITCLKF